ncbi:hypothetical protein CAPTEDRAFT_204722 [Capitella teleta]|uniref:Ku70/Ku80 N-terminal alpha/beta domain-containing protein n=1 Tax=Capitella teleta TaxID=283909 RepID=R7V8Y8_CAPTE|nr:hypothetical protein CAPTEDRAFT_204722 [Capitella teleta]|eukprot:ELU12175.1 hypothetical protein CAPTEDRAFT_204722 [Capitella teleta]
MADMKWNWGEDGESDEEEGGSGEGQWQFGSRDGLIFLIDCSKAMFEKGDEEHSPFELCIKCAKSVIQSKIISSNKDLMAVIFYATVSFSHPLSNFLISFDSRPRKRIREILRIVTSCK